MARIVWILFLCTIFPGVVGFSGSNVKDVITKLFTTDGYSNKVRPLQSQSVTLIINVEFYLNSVIDFDEQAEVLTTSGYLALTWMDEYLTWTPSDFNGTTEIFLPQDDIWKPDVSLRNTYNSFKGLGSTYLYVKVQHNGDVTWKPFQILKSTCAVDIKYFPFDKQLCEIKFTAWSYSRLEIDLNAGANGVTLEDYSANAQWELTKTSYKEVNDDSDEAAVIFEIELKRKSSFYVINIIAPVILLSVLNVCTFLLPVASGEKAGYSVTVFLSLAVFLTIIASELPKNSDVVSFMSIYLLLMSILSTLIVALSLLQIRMSEWATEQTPIKRFLVLLIKISLFLRCKSCSTKIGPRSSTVKVVEIYDDDKKSLKSVSDDDFDWSDVNDAIDFLFFWLSMIFTCVCTVVIFCLCVTHG
ncbi:neuronal acetylcholine receptor subunit beta-4-like [Ruditapes philippinarum]|uniref:neuronal acetylcholine receptor subunit beta-4-like n=1 Tax=Ruditapes philippinarum TaxID=129788 RepID=UPI00295BD1D1|nr:neuronal acetylcholine receptor subunit beta-4-like [Ruditapes philippinarum]